MTLRQYKLTLFSVTALLVLIFDQLSKTIIRTNPSLHHLEIIEGWLAFHYTKNPGMALGIDWTETWIISLIAIAATVIIMAFIFKTMDAAGKGYMICMGLIIGGALGNIYDRLFLARIEGYGGILDGHVVDFIHFTLSINGFRVFPYIFNVADSAITVAIITLLVFYKKLMPEYAHENQLAGEGLHPADSKPLSDAGSEADHPAARPVAGQSEVKPDSESSPQGNHMPVPHRNNKAETPEPEKQQMSDSRQNTAKPDALSSSQAGSRSAPNPDHNPDEMEDAGRPGRGKKS